MKITTASGATYTINANNLCVKHSARENITYPAFKAFMVKSVPADFAGTISDIYLLPEKAPTVGDLLFVSGRDEWWLSTPMTKVEN